MQAGAHVEAELANGFRDRAGAADRARRTVEAGEESVAGRVDLDAAMAHQLLAHELMMLLQHVSPTAVTERGGTLARADDVGEQNGREHAVRFHFLLFRRLPSTLQEALYLVDVTRRLRQRRNVKIPG